jgi:hypothetical protein
MTPEQAAAFINAQAACANAEIAAMQTHNKLYWEYDHIAKHTAEDFECIIDKYGISHNAVLTLFEQHGG